MQASWALPRPSRHQSALEEDSASCDSDSQSHMRCTGGCHCHHNHHCDHNHLCDHHHRAQESQQGAEGDASCHHGHPSITVADSASVWAGWRHNEGNEPAESKIQQHGRSAASQLETVRCSPVVRPFVQVLHRQALDDSDISLHSLPTLSIVTTVYMVPVDLHANAADVTSVRSSRRRQHNLLSPTMAAASTTAEPVQLALHPSWVAKLSIDLGWGKGGNVTSADFAPFSVNNHDEYLLVSLLITKFG